MEKRVYKFIDDAKENEYGKHVLVKMIRDRMANLPMEMIRAFTNEIFGTAPDIKYGSDGELIFTFPKNDDPIRDRLAQMMLLRIWNCEG